MFEDFTGRTVEVGGGVSIFARIGGKGPPVLLLHGYPQTHLCWRKVAPRLAERFTVVAADLRGYGDSSKPPGGDSHVNYSKRAMAQDQVALMRELGFKRFGLVGRWDDAVGGGTAFGPVRAHPHFRIVAMTGRAGPRSSIAVRPTSADAIPRYGPAAPATPMAVACNSASSLKWRSRSGAWPSGLHGPVNQCGIGV
jgi:pimeloyl-ACP methyl ester carboxylesterase